MGSLSSWLLWVALTQAATQSPPGTETGRIDWSTRRSATLVGEKLLDRIDRIRDGLRSTGYAHRTKVSIERGEYYWDCSGMTSWLLQRYAPEAYAAVRRDRPRARDYWRVIHRTPTDRKRNGWRQISDVENLRPGDVFAWKHRRSKARRNNTGHVGFVVGWPQAVHDDRFEPGTAFTVRIADATSIPHQDDTRVGASGEGFGFGTILLVTDAQGAPIAYGWKGLESRSPVHTRIALGRTYR